MRRAAATPITNRLTPSNGVKTMATIIKEGMFSVADPCTMLMAPSIPTPVLRNVEDIGTMQAEHRFITGPMASPFRVRLNELFPVDVPVPPAGKRKASVRPATTKAKTIPTETRRR